MVGAWDGVVRFVGGGGAFAFAFGVSYGHGISLLHPTRPLCLHGLSEINIFEQQFVVYWTAHKTPNCVLQILITDPKPPFSSCETKWPLIL